LCRVTAGLRCAEIISALERDERSLNRFCFPTRGEI
jgi:hypothetical protein